MNNKIQLLGFYGSDETIACSAWTSTSRNLTDAKRERIPNLIDTLWSDGHETPFEKGIIHFLVDTEIASHIHLLKHRISSLNGESARYKELKEDKIYLPTDWRDKGGEIGKKWFHRLNLFSQEANMLYHQCLEEMTPILGRKRMKESARFFKMYNSQIECDVMFNMRSFANFIKLRNSEHAQLEIREIAQEMWRLVSETTDDAFKSALNAIEERIVFEEKCKKYKELILSLE